MVSLDVPRSVDTPRETAGLDADVELGPSSPPRPPSGTRSQSSRRTEVASSIRPRVHPSRLLASPYTPEQNGPIERFFRGVKEECVWQRSFETFSEARRTLRR